jgi:hypothetical protein
MFAISADVGSRIFSATLWPKRYVLHSKMILYQRHQNSLFHVKILLMHTFIVNTNLLTLCHSEIFQLSKGNP